MQQEEKILNPCKSEPGEYLGISKVNRYRFKAIDLTGIGENTIEIIGLNDIQRVMIPRIEEWESLKEHLIEIETDLKEEGFKKKYKNRLRKIMEACLPDMPYSATKATNLVNDDTYNGIKNILWELNQWTEDLKKLEEEIEHIALKLV